MVAVVSDIVGFAHAMIDHVGMGQALDRMFAVAEGEHGGRQHEAKRRERGQRDRNPESESVRQCRQHPFWLLLSLQT